ncbi:MAG: M1 family aminopeptidase [Gemmatimonadetes bacterium]|nr:M1 family aminopeptidase [Gemmatimonadota bacterium]
MVFPFLPFHRPRVASARVATALLASTLLAALSPCPPAAAQPRPAAPPAAAALSGPGVSAALAAQRRATLSQVAYDLALTVGTGDTATGVVTLQVQRRGTANLIVDFRGHAIDGGAVNGTPWPGAAAAWNRHHVTVPAGMLRPGTNRIELRFRTPVAAAGAAIIRTRDATDSSTYLYTLLVPADANLLFPCLDQPDLKARVTLSLTTPADWRALANGALVDSALVASALGAGATRGAQRVHRFAATPPISTYLIAFAAGPWAVLERAEAIREGEPAGTVALWVRRSRAREAEGDTLLAMNARALRWLGRYFGAPYAFGKYDALLAPAFPFGGMEHPGAVFYNEESFIYRERPTATQLLGRQATTFHEVAHQWFGDYVTMRWFDDLWLKEGFATFMAARMQAELEPASNAWKTFYLRNKPVAYGTDATLGTTPVWQALANLDQAKSNYGPIVYNKAPSILKQLEYLVGPAAFQRGVQAFLRQHAFGNATWQSLLASIGAASGRDLAAWGRAWMLRPGMPIIEQRLTVRDGRIVQLALVQRAAQPTLAGRATWPQRVRVRLHYPGGTDVTHAVELRGDTTVVRAAAGAPAPAFVFANDGDFGYAIVLPDAASVAWLEAHVAEVTDDFLRAMLWGALWDLVREARLAPERYVDMVARALPGERDEQVAGALTGRLVTTVSRYLGDAQRDSLRPSVQRTLLALAADSARSYGNRRAPLDAFVALADGEVDAARLRGWLAGDTVAGMPLRAPMRWTIVQRLVARGAADAEALIAAALARDATTEGARQAFVAGAGVPDAAAKRALFTRWFADTTLNEEWVSASLRTFHEPSQAALTRAVLVPALDTLGWIQRNRRIFFLGTWVSSTLGGQRDAEALRAVDAWLAAQPSLPADLRQKVLQARDELDRTVRIHEQFVTPRAGSGANR